MADSQTFSAAVNAVVQKTGRPTRLNSIISYVRQSVKECQALVDAADDLIELTITSTATPHVWVKPRYFRKLIIVEYPTRYNSHGQRVRPVHRQPQHRTIQQNFNTFYATGTGYAFDVTTGLIINLAYLTWAPTFAYKADIAARQANFDNETGLWTYLPTIITDIQKREAEALVSNWVLFDWFDLVVEGASGKLWQSVGDQRSIQAFALYKSLQTDLINAKSADSYTKG